MLDNDLRFTNVDTPVGQLWVGYDERGVCLAMLGDSEQAFVERALDSLDRVAVRDSDPPLELLAAIEDRVEKDAPLGFNLDRFTPFQRAVLEAVAAIPRGEVRSYGEVALEVGHPGAARAVGEVMRTNRIPVLIPCHRVVRSGGDIGRYTPDPAIKRRLLRLEGAL
jgi:methylated-DNA-[protein]-cysteine S-methyltransferase